MSQFTSYSDGCYTYTRDGKEYTVATGMLNSLFKTHGYCVDPGTRSGIALTSQTVDQLKELSLNHHDFTLSNTIKALANGKAPSPRMLNDGIMHEITLNEKHRYDHLNETNKTHISALLRVILNIGLYLGGWKGGEEPYITALRSVHDTIRMELKVNPLIQSLYTNPHYPLIKNFPVMGYYQGGPSSYYVSKPAVIDGALNVDRCLSAISLGVNADYQKMASHLISTAYYYITTVCNTPLPMLEPLIVSLTQVS